MQQPDKSKEKENFSIIETLSYLLKTKQDSVINQGFSFLLNDCLQEYGQLYQQEIKNGKTNIAFIEIDGVKKTFKNESEIMVFCLRKSEDYVIKNFKEQLDIHETCQKACEEKNSQKVMDYFTRTQCRKKCQIMLDQITKPLAAEVFKDVFQKYQ